MSNFHPLEVVCRGSETQVGPKWVKYIYFLLGAYKVNGGASYNSVWKAIAALLVYDRLLAAQLMTNYTLHNHQQQCSAWKPNKNR